MYTLFNKLLLNISFYADTCCSTQTIDILKYFMSVFLYFDTYLHQRRCFPLMF